MAERETLLFLKNGPTPVAAIAARMRCARTSLMKRHRNADPRTGQALDADLRIRQPAAENVPTAEVPPGVRYKYLWNQIVAAKEAKGLSIAEVCKRFGGGFSNNTWNHYRQWFDGHPDGTIPDVAFLGRIAEVLDVTLVLDPNRSGVSSLQASGNSTAVGEQRRMLDFLMQRLSPEQRRAVEEAAMEKMAEFLNPSAAGVERGPSAPAKRKKK